MSSPTPTGARRDSAMPEGTLILLNRALQVMHQMRGATHDLNNALMLIGGSAELLRSDPELSAAMAARMDRILRQAQRSTAIVERMASLVRGTGNEPGRIDLAGICEEALQMRRYDLDRTGVSLAAVLPPGVAVVRAGRADLQLAVLNLLRGAEDAVAGRQGGRIALSIAAEGTDARLAVEDNGTRPDLGDATVAAAEPAATSAILALEATHLIAVRYQGALTVEPREEGGTTAILRLPLAS